MPRTGGRKSTLDGECTIMVMPRHYQRRRAMPRAVVQSFKKVINIAAVSQAAGSRNITLSQGVDSVAAGQTGPTDAQVPTGAIIKFFEIQIGLGQIVGGSVIVHYSVQLVRTDQTAVISNVVGGSAKRNQVFRQNLYSLGINQNFNRTIPFKIPPRFQRVREGDIWLLEITTSNTLTQVFQIIYKFYR